MISIESYIFQHSIQVSLHQFIPFVISHVSYTINECLHVVDINKVINFFEFSSFIFRLHCKDYSSEESLLRRLRSYLRDNYLLRDKKIIQNN